MLPMRPSDKHHAQESREPRGKMARGGVVETGGRCHRPQLPPKLEWGWTGKDRHFPQGPKEVQPCEHLTFQLQPSSLQRNFWNPDDGPANEHKGYWEISSS